MNRSILRVASLASLLAAACSGPPDVREETGRATQPVIDGHALDAAMYPAVGALVHWTESGMFFLDCTATLVAPRVVLTAAHCVAGDALLPSFTQLSDPTRATPGTAVAAIRAFVASDYDPFASGSLHDIALLELATPIDGAQLDPWLEPADAPGVLRAGDAVMLVGYGAVAADAGGSVENGAGSRIASVTDDEMIIGGPGEVQSCVGDSGGPSYVTLSTGERRLAGVVSRSADPTSECGAGSVHTRVDAYAGWVRATIDGIETPPPRAGCAIARGATTRSGGLGWVLALVTAVISVRWRRSRSA
jgi:secreted trypsin-like serine protease